MKRFKAILFAILFANIALISACGGGGGGDDTPDLTPEEQRLLALAGTSGITWEATSVTFDGATSNNFDSFTLTFRGSASSKSYTSVSGDPVFQASGTWDFNGTNINQLIFDGNSGNIFTVSNLNASATPPTVTLTVDFSGGGGAAAGTDGRYVFNLRQRQ